VDGAAAALEQRGDPFHLVAHHVAADVVGVEVGDEHPGDLHAVGLDQIEQLVHRVGRIDEDALALHPVADGVGEVHHLLRDRIVVGEVAARQQLAEVEPVAGPWK
jgi:hypothetical protein